MVDAVAVKRTTSAFAEELFVDDDVADRNAIVFNDLIGTGTTLHRAAAKCREAGARRVFAAAMHGRFIGDALGTIGAAEFDGIVVGEMVRSAAEETGLLPASVVTLDTSGLIKRRYRPGASRNLG